MNLRTLDLNLLLVFDAILQDRQVSRAADRMGRSQSALSHSLKKLRQVFGDDLFVRAGGEMEPTPRALELAGPIAAALADIQGALDRYAAFDPATSSRGFTIGMSDSTALMFLPGLIRRFRAEAPGATVNVRNVSPARGYQLLRAGELDCVVIGNAPPVAEHLVAEAILTEKFLCAMWDRNPVLDGPFTLEAYLSCPHLQVSLDGVSPGQIDVELEKRGLRRNVVATIPHYLVIPWVLVETDAIVTCGEDPLLAVEGTCDIALARPPVPVPDVVFSLITDERVRTDPGNIWLRSLIVDRADELRRQKDAIYRSKPTLFG